MPVPSNARRCANCPSIRTAGGPPPATRKVLLGSQQRRRIRSQTRGKRIAPNTLSGRIPFKILFDAPKFTPVKNPDSHGNPLDRGPGSANLPIGGFLLYLQSKPPIGRLALPGSADYPVAAGEKNPAPSCVRTSGPLARRSACHNFRFSGGVLG